MVRVRVRVRVGRVRVRIKVRVSRIPKHGIKCLDGFLANHSRISRAIDYSISCVFGVRLRRKNKAM
jgi:hypothetical protein